MPKPAKKELLKLQVAASRTSSLGTSSKRAMLPPCYLLAVTVIAVAVILLGSFIGKMLVYVACLFAVYVVGLMTVSSLCRLASKVSRFHRHHPGGFIVAL